MKIVTPKELLPVLKVDELVNPIVTEICEAFTRELRQLFSSMELTSRVSKIIEIELKAASINSSELREQKAVLLKRLTVACKQSHWIVTDLHIAINGTEIPEYSHIECGAKFKSNNFD